MLGFQRLVCAAILVAVSFTSVVARAERPVWQALPDETLAVVRVPAPKAFYEALRTRTKLGKVAFEERRLEAVRDALLAEEKEGLEKITEGLNKFGIELDDVLTLTREEVGVALGTLPGEEAKQTLCYLAWAECGQATGDKWLAAVEKAVDEERGENDRMQREDVELAGVKVLHVTTPRIATHGTAKLNVGVKVGTKGGKLDAGLDIKEDDVDWKNGVVEGHEHVLICRSAESLLAYYIVPPAVKGESPSAEDLEKARREYGEKARMSLAKLLEAKRADGEGIVQRWLHTPGLAVALPEGVPAVEIVGDLQGVVKLFDRPATKDQWKLLQAMGLDRLGPAAYRMALDGTTLRSGTFFSMPEPRQGALTLIDQPPLPPQAADWVAGDVVGYQHLSFDFGKAYKQIAEIVRHNSQKGEESIAAIEAQAQQFLQVDVAALLSSLGTKHVLISFLPDVPQNKKGETDTAAQNTMAVVWRVSDEALWKRLMQTAALVSGQAAKQEQGYTGLRHEQGEFHGGWFIGDGNMVLAFGKGVTEKALAMLRNPPRTGDSLAGSAIARRAAELVPPQNAITYEITNGSTVLKYLNLAAEQSLEESKDPSLQKLKTVWPSREELEGVVGVSAAVTHVDRNGLTHLSVSDLPAP